MDSKITSVPVKLVACATKKPTWYGLAIPAPLQSVRDAAERGVKDNKDQVKSATTSTTEFHATLLWWGKEDAKRWKEIDAYVATKNLTTADVVYADAPYFVQPPHTEKQDEAYWCVDIKAPRLEQLKDELRLLFAKDDPNPAEAGGRKVPVHATLYVVKRRANTDNLDADCRQYV
jgi:hypothetical protein